MWIGHAKDQRRMHMAYAKYLKRTRRITILTAATEGKHEQDERHNTDVAGNNAHGM
jgi:hypothetical protein